MLTVVLMAILLLALFGAAQFCGSVAGAVLAAIPVASVVMALIGRLA